jgi:putative multiple sugar transport system ATP-binding protein
VSVAGDTLLEMRGITKTFPGVKALSQVELAVRAGEIHAVVGENGAGKSTLMKVLSGVYPCDSYEGEIRFDGEARRFRGIADSEKLGIIIIHQELALVPLLSITENIFMGNEIARGGVIDWFAAHATTRALLAKVGLAESPTTLVTDLGVGKQQLVEIAKALSKDVRLLILDEPTASLNERDSDALLMLLLELKRQGIASILISHKLNEIAKVADAITVLRDGTTVETMDCRAAPISEDRIIRGMVGRDMEHRYPQRTPRIGETVFEVSDWHVHHAVHAEREMIKGVALNVRRGEIVGIAGLMGAGRTEFVMSVFGRSWGQRIRGTVRMNGQPVDVSTVRKAIDHGIAYVTEDRKGFGLVLEEDIRKNITLANLEAVSTRCRHRRGPRMESGGRLPPGAAHPLLRHRPAGGEPVGRQPAEGGAEQMAVRQTGAADPRRAHARHRRRRQVRDIHHHRPARPGGQRHLDDLVGTARAARHVRPYLCDERRPLRSRIPGGGGLAGTHHARDREFRELRPCPPVTPKRHSLPSR